MPSERQTEIYPLDSLLSANLQIHSQKLQHQTFTADNAFLWLCGQKTVGMQTTMVARRIQLGRRLFLDASCHRLVHSVRNERKREIACRNSHLFGAQLGKELDLGTHKQKCVILLFSMQIGNNT